MQGLHGTVPYKILIATCHRDNLSFSLSARLYIIFTLIPYDTIHHTFDALFSENHIPTSWTNQKNEDHRVSHVFSLGAVSVTRNYVFAFFFTTMVRIVVVRTILPIHRRVQIWGEIKILVPRAAHACSTGVSEEEKDEARPVDLLC